MDAERWMRRALRLAERGRGTVSPNPLVGCVLVRDGDVVGEGWHERPGGPHAEVAALAAAGERARGATAYVTLEPCDHTGRTGPCTRALVAAGVARVVVALGDPHPQAGGGAERLRAAGIDVEVGLLAGEAERQNVVFLHALATGRPFVVVKSAVSLDGRIAAADGSSRWITGPEARRRGHGLRAESDAVLVGSGTVLADDPLLTVRLDGDRPGAGGGGSRPAPPLEEAGAAPAVAAPSRPLRVVLDARGRVEPRHRVVDASAPTLVLTAPGPMADRLEQRLGGANVEVAAVPAAGPPGGLDLDAVLDTLWDRDVRSVLVEGGAQVAAAFVRAGLADRLVVHLAPVVLGERGRPAFVGAWPASLDHAPRFRLEEVERAGDDTLLSFEPLSPARLRTGVRPRSRTASRGRVASREREAS